MPAVRHRRRQVISVDVLQAYSGSRGKAPFILNHETGWMSVANFTPMPLAGSRAFVDITANTQTLDRTARSLVTTPTELFWLFLNDNRIMKLETLEIQDYRKTMS